VVRRSDLLARKAALVSGSGFWSTVGDESAGIRSIVVADGPHGLRLQRDGGDHLGLGEAVRATCFPPASGLASSWNVDLVERVGIALGEEARAEGVGVLLGPGVNIKRSPLCGRNFEYFSEDPLVSGELGAAWVSGLQSTGVGASLKHFAANNQETNRMTVSAEVDERTLRELYFPAFETIVKRENPLTVMCSYNRINGIWAAENHWLLTTVLRDEWGFDGLVMSDWGAVDNMVPALAAGTDLEMPGPQRDTVEAIVGAIADGSLDESVLDVAVSRLRTLVDHVPTDAPPYDAIAHHELAREAALESMVLLRNEGGILPLAPTERIAVIGEFARTPRIQGAGSSQVSASRVDSALEHLAAGADVTFEPGYLLQGSPQPAADSLIEAAVRSAAAADVAVLFVGLDEGAESEGYDRTTLDLPADQVELIAAVTAVQPRTVVVLTNGGVVSLEPWHDSAAAILETWLLGQGVGAAVASVLLGTDAPTGRLAESIPFRVQDNPSYLNFPGDGDEVRYAEGVFVGYRYYESAEVPVRYPFGFGLGYTTFAYDNLEVSRDGREVAVTVTNTGERRGAEVAQLYVSAPAVPVRGPVRELRAFAKVWLDPGESRRVHFTLGDRAFSHWDVPSSDWIIERGDYEIQVGPSSHDLPLRQTVTLTGQRPEQPLSLDSPVSAFLEHPVTGPLFRLAAAGRDKDGPTEGGTSVLDMVSSMPMRRLVRFPGVPVVAWQVRALSAVANLRPVRAVARLFGR